MRAYISLLNIAALTDGLACSRPASAASRDGMEKYLMESSQKYNFFMDIACPQCGCTMGNSGQGDIFTCPRCGWHGRAKIDPSDIALINQIICKHREGKGENGNDG